MVNSPLQQAELRVLGLQVDSRQRVTGRLGGPQNFHRD